MNQENLHTGDIVISRERGAPSGRCLVGAVGEVAHAETATYAEALRRAKRLAAGQSVDVWATFRVRWSDDKPQLFQRLATHRVRA